MNVHVKYSWDVGDVNWDAPQSDADWDEEKHPRGQGGKFESGSTEGLSLKEWVAANPNLIAALKKERWVRNDADLKEMYNDPKGIRYFIQSQKRLAAEEKAGEVANLTPGETKQLKAWGTENAKDYEKVRSSKDFGSAIDKLSRYSGTVHRGMILSQKEAESLKPGTITLTKHSSASPSGRVATDFAFGAGDTNRDDEATAKNLKSGEVPVVMTIHGAKNVGNFGVSKFSGFGKGEPEVILKMGTKLKILNVKQVTMRGTAGYRVSAKYVG